MSLSANYYKYVQAKAARRTPRKPARNDYSPAYLPPSLRISAREPDETTGISVCNRKVTRRRENQRRRWPRPRRCGESHLRLKFTQREIGIPSERTDATQNRWNCCTKVVLPATKPPPFWPVPPRSPSGVSADFVSTGRAPRDPDAPSSRPSTTFDIAFSDGRQEEALRATVHLDPRRSLPPPSPRSFFAALFPRSFAFPLHSVDWFSSARVLLRSWKNAPADKKRKAEKLR